MNKLKEFLIADADNFRPLRLRVLRPVYSRETVNESAHSFLAKRSISSSRQLYDMFSDLTHETREHFLALHLDSKNKIMRAPGNMNIAQQEYLDGIMNQNVMQNQGFIQTQGANNSLRKSHGFQNNLNLDGRKT